MKKMVSLLSIGVLSSIVIGFFMKGIQALTAEKVYTLLLNVDYIPVLRSLSMNEFIEFMLHVIVSIVLVYVLYFSLKHYELHKKTVVYILITFVVGMLLWVTTTLSSRTPELMDGTALLYWLLGHVLYGSFIGIIIKLVED
ncbi:hypothetical protein VBD025_05295 [Virgibacillus flavescens]|uniref:hypothetical protein n=1 Tax=Virgibacillus flavescens TaxID=1611422 RepID=UPI003D33155C